MSTSSADVDVDDMDDNGVDLVRIPTSRMSLPTYSGLLKPSPTAKRTVKGTPIEMPTAQRRESNFSVFIPKAESSQGSRENSQYKKPFTSVAKSPFIARQASQDAFDDQKPKHSSGSIESRHKEKPTEVVLLSDEDEMKDPKTVKRKKHTQGADDHINSIRAGEIKSSSLVSRMKKANTPVVSDTSSSHMDIDLTPAPVNSQSIERLPNLAKLGSSTVHPTLSLSKHVPVTSRLSSISTKSTQPLVKSIPSSTRPTSSTTMSSSVAAKPVPTYVAPISPPTKSFSIFTSTSTPISSQSLSGHAKSLSPISPLFKEKSSQMGIGSFPQLPLECVRVGTKIEFKRQKMNLQLGPDRFIINIDKNTTKILHDTLRTVGYYVEGKTNFIILSTLKQLDSESILAPYYDPSPHSSKARKLVLYFTSNEPNIEEYCDKLASMGFSAHKLTFESAEKYLEGLRTPAQTPKESSSTITTSSSVNALTPQIANSPDNIKPRQTLFMFPFKSTPKSRSIAVHIEDLGRLFEGDFLNDILIEFGLKYIYEGLEKNYPELAKRTYIFNSFFYQRLIAKPAAGMSAYDAVKSWTNKIDLFDMDCIVVPICEKAHWYLAIITNPGLLLQEKGDQAQAKLDNISTTTSPVSSPKLDSKSGSPFSSTGSPDFPSVMDSIESLTSQVWAKKDYGSNGGSVTKTDDELGRPKRSLRSAVPIDVNASPYIIVLDSLGGSHPAVFKALKAYLQNELLARKGIKRTSTMNEIIGKYAKPPQQQNFSDCGLYLLHYAEVFLKNPHVLLDGIVNHDPELEKHWMAEELPNKREYYQHVVVQLAEDYKEYLANQ
ncbi:hypothetical protein FBU30_006826 [Linnemannia zychae]|nr:hypothetical protein FBU30_006826 [Linnemannia zychae]